MPQHIMGNDKDEVQMLQHNHHNIPPPKGKYKGQKWKQHYNRNSPHKKRLNPNSLTSSHHKNNICSHYKIQCIETDFIAQQRSLNCHKTGHFTNCCFKKQKDKNNKGNYDKNDTHGITITKDDDNNGYSSHDSNKVIMPIVVHLVRKHSLLDQSNLPRSTK